MDAVLKQCVDVLAYLRDNVLNNNDDACDRINEALDAVAAEYPNE